MRGKTFHIEVNKSDTIADLNILLLANENKNAASVGTKKKTPCNIIFSIDILMEFIQFSGKIFTLYIDCKCQNSNW